MLGDHVQQAGSYVDDGRLRFDFTHFAAMTEEELQKTEDLVNEQIARDLSVMTSVMSLDEARKTGAMALFGEKYGEKVRVVRMGDFSTELCGGTHVSSTGAIRAFKILSENGVASGVRRIEALTGNAVFSYYREMEEQMRAAAAELKCPSAELLERVRHLLADDKKIRSELEAAKSAAAKDALGNISDEIVSIGSLSFLGRKLTGVDMNGLRQLGDSLKEQIRDGVFVLASENEGKANLLVVCSDAAVSAGIKAGDLIKSIAPMVGGGGGGRPAMAQAGGKNPAGIDDALKAAQQYVKERI